MSTYINLIILLIMAILLAILLVPICRSVAFRLNILDRPHERKIHSKPIPYLGGAAIFASYLLGLFSVTYIYEWLDSKTGMVLLISSSFIFLLGTIDDIRGTNARLKLAVQVAVAFFVVNNGIYISEITNPFGGGYIQLGVFGKVISILWIVAISNAINLLDGLDGLAGGVSAIAIVFMASFAVYGNDFALAGLLIGLLGGIIGFLIFNFPPASIFMGDMGSLLIGFLFSVFCLKADHKGPYAVAILIPAMLMTIPIFDTLLAIIRRAKKGNPIFSADKEHLHHRILALSKSYKKTLYYIYLINVFIGIIATVTFLIPNEYRILLIVFLAQDIMLGLFILRLFEDRNFWRDKAEK